VKINLCSNLHVFNKKYNQKDLVMLKIGFEKYVLEEANTINAPYHIIRGIYIIRLDSTKNFGEVKVADNKIDLFFTENILLNYVQKKYDKIEHIIRHELFHIIDIDNIITKIGYDLVNQNKSFGNTHDHLVDFGMHNFSEYYAHSLATENDEMDDFATEVEDCELSIKAVVLFLKNNNEAIYIDKIRNSIEKFITSLIIICARDNQFDGYFENYINTLRINHKEIYRYCLFIKSAIKLLYDDYPNFINREKYFEIGRILYSIWDEYGVSLDVHEFIITKKMDLN
jgi:hypothetical protein